MKEWKFELHARAAGGPSARGMGIDILEIWLHLDDRRGGGSPAHQHWNSSHTTKNASELTFKVRADHVAPGPRPMATWIKRSLWRQNHTSPSSRKYQPLPTIPCWAGSAARQHGGLGTGGDWQGIVESMAALNPLCARALSVREYPRLGEPGSSQRSR